MYDLPNHITRWQGTELKVDFNILSEYMSGGNRMLELRGQDEQGNTFTASGQFDKKTYELIITNLQTIQ